MHQPSAPDMLGIPITHAVLSISISTINRLEYHTHDMITPQYNDVLSGRGNGVGNHDGNVQFRSIVGNYIHEYDRTSSNASKKAVAMKIRKEIESLDPPGRFLSEKQGLYFPQGEKEILGKIKQALRDRLKAERGSQVSQQVRHAQSTSVLSLER